MMGIKRILFPEEDESSSLFIRKPAWGDSLAGCADESSSFAKQNQKQNQNPAAAHRRGKRQRDQQSSQGVSVLMTLDPTLEPITVNANTDANTNANTTRRIRQSTITKRRTEPVDSLGSLGLVLVTSSSSVLGRSSLGGTNTSTTTSSSSSSRRNYNSNSNSKIDFKSKPKTTSNSKSNNKSNKRKSLKSIFKSSQQAKAKWKRSKRTRDHADMASTTTSGLGAFCNLKMSRNRYQVEQQQQQQQQQQHQKSVPLCRSTGSGGLCDFVGLNHQGIQKKSSKATEKSSKVKVRGNDNVNVNDQSKAIQDSKVSKVRTNAILSKPPPPRNANDQSPPPTSLTLMMDKENADKPQTSTSKASNHNSKSIQEKASKVNIQGQGQVQGQVQVQVQVQSKAMKEPKASQAKTNAIISKPPPRKANDAENVQVRPTTTRKHRMSTRSLRRSDVEACEMEQDTDTDTTAATPSLEPEDVGAATELDDMKTGEPASVMVDNNDDDDDDDYIAPPEKDDDQSSHPIGNATNNGIDTAVSMEKVVDVPKVITECRPREKPTTKRKKHRNASPSKTTRRRSGRLAKIQQYCSETEEFSLKQGGERFASSKSSTVSSTSSNDMPPKVTGSSAVEGKVIFASTIDNCQRSPIDNVIEPSSPMETKDEEQNSGAAWRSRRNVAPPDRFGSYLKDDNADGTRGNTVESVQNKELAVQVIASASTASSQSKQRLVHTKPPKGRPSSKRQKSKLPKRGTRNPKVRVSEEETNNGTMDGSATEQRSGGMEWTTDEVNGLRTAHKTIDPKSVSFWQDVAERLEPRSSSDCREKWFSLIQTPVMRPKRKQDTQSSADIAAHAVSFDEDDIFNSTPMRSLFSEADSQAIQASSEYTGIGCLSHLSFGSAIKVGNPRAAIGNGVSTTLHSKAGYKTYIKGIRRDANRASKTRIRKKPKAGVPSMPPRKKISEKFREGEMAMNGQLSPGGTIKVQKLGGDTSDEDDEFYNEGMEDEAHDF
jgi:hypothetical protein